MTNEVRDTEIAEWRSNLENSESFKRALDCIEHAKSELSDLGWGLLAIGEARAALEFAVAILKQIEGEPV